MIRVLVAEDSATARALLVSLLSGEPDITVVGEATTGAEAVEMAERLAPDLVTMDVHMPELDGLEATKRIMTRSPRPILIVSSAAKDDVELSLEATRSGALMVIAKPQGLQAPGFAADRRHLISMVRALAQVKVVRRHGAPLGMSLRATPASSASILASGRTAATELLAIAASTGGPAALRTILSQLPASLPVPVLVVQHIARGFTAGLADWLAGDSPMPIKVAELGERALAGTVYIAPDDRHLGIRRGPEGDLRIVLDNTASLGTFRPSATYLFRSCAESVGRGVLALILTGMGDDGVDGLRDVRRAGGRILAQDEASSVIYGMPREAKRAGVVDLVVSLDDAARRIREIVA
ncbi:MAG: chemotaxis response regulator protein-glutamate methylesterase [Gemmatimonadetes bacterium]|nr:chemotaxis response regulator protein-glutamate methylesterase [Gemmatimonadota bacterium]